MLPSAQAQSCGNGPRHLVYALVSSREYKKDLILMCIMSQLRTVFFGATATVPWPPLWRCSKVLKPNFQSIISQTNKGCSFLSLILAKLLLLDTNSKNVFALSIVTVSGVATGGGEDGGYNLLLIEPQMASCIIEIVRTKCIVGEALKVRGQKYDKISLKIVQKALKWPLQYANF